MANQEKSMAITLIVHQINRLKNDYGKQIQRVTKKTGFSWSSYSSFQLVLTWRNGRLAQWLTPTVVNLKTWKCPNPQKNPCKIGVSWVRFSHSVFWFFFWFVFFLLRILSWAEGGGGVCSPFSFLLIIFLVIMLTNTSLFDKCFMDSCSCPHFAQAAK